MRQDESKSLRLHETGWGSPGSFQQDGGHALLIHSICLPFQNIGYVSLDQIVVRSDFYAIAVDGATLLDGSHFMWAYEPEVQGWWVGSRETDDTKTGTRYPSFRSREAMWTPVYPGIPVTCRRHVSASTTQISSA